MKKVLIIIVVLLIVLAGGGLGVWSFIQERSSYYAIYLETGDVYFGQITRFPSFGLKNAYVLQVNPQDEQNPLALQKFSNLFWEPEGQVKINKKKVVWIAKLKQGGNLAELLKNGGEAGPTGSVPGGGAPQGAPVIPPIPQNGGFEPPTSTFP